LENDLRNQARMVFLAGDRRLDRGERVGGKRGSEGGSPWRQA
jgi:hypothetical protein